MMHDPENDFRSWCDPELETIESCFGPADYVLLALVAVCIVALFVVEFYGSAMP